MKTIISLLFAGALITAAQSQVPILNSYPAANAVIYLDFDGQYVQGSAWNWNGPIDAQPALLSSDQISEIFNRVAEDYGIFNLNITTDSAVFLAAPAASKTRIIITATSQWYGPAGGVSFVGSFSWGNNTPAWVFSSLQQNDVKKISEAIAHEAGHTLGLQHQSIFDVNCNKTFEYSDGQGTGEIGWAPIMGSGYSRNLTTWHNGTSSMGCNSLQSDIHLITASTNNFGLRNDDHQDTYTNATMLPNGTNFSATGIINHSTDRDAFKFNVGSSTNFRLNVIPQNVGAGNSGANVDIKLTLLNQFADTIGRYNPLGLLNVGLDTNLSSGAYYLIVDGVANANLSEYGSLGFYTLAGVLNTALPIHRLSLQGRINDGGHKLNWNYFADETVKEIHIESSNDGIHFNFLANLSANARSFSWIPLDNKPLNYRVKVITAADERAYYSNIIVIRNQAPGTAFDVINHLVTDYIRINAEKNFSYQLLDETGRLLQRGQLVQGSNQISTSSIKNGFIFMRLQHNNEVYNQKFIKR